MTYPTHCTKTEYAGMPNRKCPNCGTIAQPRWKEDRGHHENPLDPGGAIWWPCYTPLCEGKDGIVD